MFDPYRKIMTPDFQANQNLPAWIPMGEDDQGQQTADSTGTFVDLLKKRLAGGGAAAAGEKGGAMMGSGGKGLMGGGEGGGGASL